KKRGYVTHDQINSVLPSEEVNSEQIEDVLAMFSEMGVNVVETEETSEEGEEAREEADEDCESEGGDLVEVQQKVPAKAEAKEPTERTDDPVRMYLREMGSVELVRSKIETVEKMVSFPFPACLGSSRGLEFFGNRSRIGWRGGRMDWARILAYVTGTVDQELLARIEYLAAENRILKAQLKGRLKLSDAERATLADIGHLLGRKVL